MCVFGLVLLFVFSEHPEQHAPNAEGNLLPPRGLWRPGSPSQDGTSCGTAGAGVTRKKIPFCPPTNSSHCPCRPPGSSGGPRGYSHRPVRTATDREGQRVFLVLSPGKGTRVGLNVCWSPPWVLSVSMHGTDRRDGPFPVTERKKGTQFHPWKTAGNAGLARLQSGSVGVLRGAGLGSSSPSPPAARAAAPLPHPSLPAARLRLNRVDGAERGVGRNTFAH